MRSADTYRGARRNKCLRELKTVWNQTWYYEGHRAHYGRVTMLSRTPSRYHPMKEMRDYAKSMGAKMTAGIRAVAKKASLSITMRPTGRGGARGT